MSEDVSRTRFILFLVVAIIVGSWFMFRSFSNPDMTRTRLLFTFWPDYMIGLGLVFIAYLFTRD